MKLPLRKPSPPVLGSGATPRPAIVRPNLKPVQPAAPPAPEPDVVKGVTKTVTVRMPPNIQKLLDKNMEVRECDRSEAVKCGIRTENRILSAHNAKLILTYANGETETVHMMRNGVPC